MDQSNLFNAQSPFAKTFSEEHVATIAAKALRHLTDYLRLLDYRGPDPLTLDEASRLIDAINSR